METSSTTHDVILTTAFGLSFLRAKVFLRSLALTGFRGKLVVLTANLRAADRAAYAASNAEVVDHGLHLHRVLRRPLQMLFWRQIRQRADAGALTPPWDRLQQPNVLRWSLYRRYLAARRGEFDRVLMVDLRDTVFQSDPFARCTANRLRVFAEEDDVRVEDSAWNTQTMRLAFGEAVYQRTRLLKVSCSGAVMGGTESVLCYLDAFATMLQEVDLPDHGTDQALHIRIVHENPGHVDFLGNRKAEVCHLGNIKDLVVVPRDGSGHLLNSHGEPFALVHQYDRHPSYAVELQEQFG